MAEKVSAAMVKPLLCFIPTRMSSAASMDSITMARALASFEEEVFVYAHINNPSSVQQLYTRVKLCTPCACERAAAALATSYGVNPAGNC